jgi:hypothetical protein
MNYQKSFTAAACISGLLLLAACAPPNQPLAPDQLNQICQNLRQQIITDSNNNAPEQFGNDPTKQATLYKGYDQNNCDEVLNLSSTTMSNPRTTNRKKNRNQ